MRYEKIYGDTQAEALRKMRSVYGEEAILISETQVQVPGMISRIMGKKRWEISLGISEKKRPENKIQSSSSSRLRNLDSALDHSFSRSERGNFAEEKELFLRKFPPPRKELSGGLDKLALLENLLEKTTKPQVENHNIDENKISLEKILREVESLKSSITSPVQVTPVMEKEFELLTKHLISQGFTETYCKGFMNDLKVSMPANEWSNRQKISEKAHSILSARIQARPNAGQKKVIVLVGPTGVGKTTMIARLAAALGPQIQKKIELVTLDIYRIAATSQLKVFADILEMPMHVCKNNEDLSKVMAESSADYILVDTSGASPKNQDLLEAQRKILEAVQGQADVHLVIAANCKKEDAEGILKRFDIFQYNRLILSKIDESTTFGAIVELQESWSKPFSYFGMGQDVLKDYTPANAEYLSELILKKWANFEQ